MREAESRRKRPSFTHDRTWAVLSSAFLRGKICADPYKLHGNHPRLAQVTDHIRPHKGNEELFYDQTNWQPLCKSCHDRKTALEDGRWAQK
jgi:5-methylcytosine-specific restriction endonuclease McrA